MTAKVLVVDDEELIRWSLSEELAAAGYKACSAQGVSEALALVEKESPDVVLTDLRLGGENGLDLLRAVRRGHPGTAVVLMTGFADLASAVSALREGAADYISKPLQMAGLKITLERVLETASLRSRLREAHRRRRDKYNFDSIVAESPAMKEALGLARKIAASPQGNVLILGESGTGKDRLARAIHYESARAEAPLMEVSCTAIPEHLLESELFGYEKGAFTGAQQQKKGLFEMADRGTVFLNEIGHMPAGLQAKILRVLEDKTFKRVGGAEDVTVDVRVLAATNEDLDRAVAAGRFRADLFYRINVLTIRLTPLRERREDILPLAERLAERLARELGRPRVTFPPETLAAFASYAWPGNARQLRNAVERMLILDERTFCPDCPPPAPAAEGPRLPEEGIVLEELEKTMVQQAIQRAGGNQQKAAQLLGISRDALRRRLEKFGLKAGALAAALLCAVSVRAGWFGTPRKPEAAGVDLFLKAHVEKAREYAAAGALHKPLYEGKCSACHADPADPKKLVKELKPLCLSCHKEREESLKKPHVHAAFKDNDCTLCHDPHASKEPHLLVQPAGDLCAMCHDATDDALKKAHFAIIPSSGSCLSCHDPHGTDNERLLAGGKEHVPFGSRACDMCHEPSTDGKALLKPTPEKTCFVCHPDLRVKKGLAVVHPPFAAGDCVACHDPHVRRLPALRKDKLGVVCFSCHDKTLEDNHPVAGHRTSKEGTADPRRPDKPFDCASCHDPHASTEKKLLTVDPRNVCASCHDK